MSGAAVMAGARTPFCRAGGTLRDVPALDLALAAATAALAAAATEGGALDGLVLACAVPEDVQMAAALAARAGASAPAVQVAGGDAAGLHAVAVAAAMVGAGAGRVLVVGSDSASRAPYWLPGLRWGASPDPAEVVDPLAAPLAAAGQRAGAGVSRAEADAFAARSHARSRATPAGSAVAVAGVGADEAAGADRSPAALAALKPLFDPDGVDTAGAVALPADGAAALVLGRGAGGAVIETPAGALPEAAEAELHEGTASQAIAAARALGLDPEAVNPAGGAIGFGHPLGASGVAMVLRLAARLAPGGHGLAAIGETVLVLRR